MEHTLYTLAMSTICFSFAIYSLAQLISLIVYKRAYTGGFIYPIAGAIILSLMALILARVMYP